MTWQITTVLEAARLPHSDFEDWQTPEAQDALAPVVVVDVLQRLTTTAAIVGRGFGLDDMRGRVGLISQRLRTLALDTARMSGRSARRTAPPTTSTRRPKPGLGA